MSRRYIDADNLKILLICAEKELTIEDIVNYIDNNICNDAIPLDKVEQIKAEIESRLQGVNITLEILVKDDALIPRMEAAKTTLENVLEIIDKAIKEQNE